MLLYKRFERCVDALKRNRLDELRHLLDEISPYGLKPRAQALFDYLSVSAGVADPALVGNVDDHVLLADLGVIILLTAGDPQALSKTIASVEALRTGSRRTVHCLVLECLSASTDVNALQEIAIEPLPEPISTALKTGALDYIVDYGWTNKALRRAIRCSAGRYVSLLREGDVLRWSEPDDPLSHLPVGYDVLIGGLREDEDSSTMTGPGLAAGRGTLRALPGLIAASTVYDSMVLVDRDYVDDLLGTVHYDADVNYFGYLNEILVVGLTQDSGRVGFFPSIVCKPESRNLFYHNRRLVDYTLSCILERRKARPPAFECGTERLIDAVLDSCRVAFGQQDLAAVPATLNVRNDDLTSFMDGKLGVAAQHAINLLCVDLKSDGQTGRNISSAASLQADTEVPVLSFISSLFQGQRLIYSFLKNLTMQSIYRSAELIMVSPVANLVQDLLCELFALASSNVRLIYLDRDPGIYGCWNIAIARARGCYVSNANLDDRRDQDQARRLVNLLESTGADVASAAVAISHSAGEISDFDGNVSARAGTGGGEVWFGDAIDQGTSRGVRDFFKFGARGEVLQCFNFPHCMPVWRRDLHQRHGFFDEEVNGTYADFAFWLRVASCDGRFEHLSTPLGLYYVDPKSHNRRNSNQNFWEEIIRQHLGPDVELNIPQHLSVSVEPSSVPGATLATGKPRLNFGEQIVQSYGRHRSGWSYVLGGLARYHDPDAATYCDTFIEKKFVWGSNPGEGGCGPVQPYENPWIGFVHVPPNVPIWFQGEQSNQRIFSRKACRHSLRSCKGLFVMTNYHRQRLTRMLRPDFPIDVLYHPTEFPDVAFEFERYLANPCKRLVQVGWWLRKLNALASISVAGHTPTMLGKNDWSKNLLSYTERRINGLTSPARAEIIDFLDNEAYDRLLSENLVFLDFYDTSANNAVIECLARGTPLVVCRHPAVEEYLGRDYPLFYNEYIEIERLVVDTGRVRAAHDWMLNSAARNRLRLDFFLSAFSASEIVKGLF